ncbi:MAG: hypothetical protein AAF705_17250, partial [Bacteroidota bacterium]
MKTGFNLSIFFCLSLLILGISCQENYGPFDEKYNVTDLVWTIPIKVDTPINFQQFSIEIQPEAAPIRSAGNTENFVPRNYSEDLMLSDTDDLLLDLKITANRDFNPTHTKGENLV